jgi:DNA-binding NarL/FixJ family response regulator
LETTSKIAILDNYALFSSGIKSILHSSDELEVIAEGVDPEDLAIILKDHTPDIILINILHCLNGGIATVKKTRKFFPGIPFLLITNSEFTDCYLDFIEFGVKGFIYTTDSPAALIESIKSICNGRGDFKKEKISMDSSGGHHQTKKYILTDRETEVLKLFCCGLTYREIGDRLFISRRTVESHKKNILSKLKITSTAEMVKYAARNKLISN